MRLRSSAARSWWNYSEQLLSQEQLFELQRRKLHASLYPTELCINNREILIELVEDSQLLRSFMYNKNDLNVLLKIDDELTLQLSQFSTLPAGLRLKFPRKLYYTSVGYLSLRDIKHLNLMIKNFQMLYLCLAKIVNVIVEDPHSLYMVYPPKGNFRKIVTLLPLLKFLEKAKIERFIAKNSRLAKMSDDFKEILQYLPRTDAGLIKEAYRMDNSRVRDYLINSPQSNTPSFPFEYNLF